MKRSLKYMANLQNLPWAIVSLDKQPYAISVQYVQEMLIAPDVARVPKTAEWVRGVLNLRGRAMPLLDLRKRIGIISRLDEIDSFCQLMAEREQDHRNWLSELEASVRERRTFGLTTDPHQCKFGKWYDAYEAPNRVLKEVLARFDTPHKAIHAVGVEVTRLMAEQKVEAAESAIEETRNGVLARMIELFADLRQAARESQREIAVVLKTDTASCAVCVDSVDSVEPLAGDSVEGLSQEAVSLQASALTNRVGRRSRTGDMVLILDTQALLNSLGPMPS
jgi:purine-binding chemotaxis protein CheW